MNEVNFTVQYYDLMFPLVLLHQSLTVPLTNYTAEVVSELACPDKEVVILTLVNTYDSTMVLVGMVEHEGLLLT